MEKSTQKMRFRLLCAVFLVMILVAGYVSFVMYRVAVTESDKYQALANSQQFKTMTIAANRGSIYDSTGQVLAQASALNPQTQFGASRYTPSLSTLRHFGRETKRVKTI